MPARRIVAARRRAPARVRTPADRIVAALGGPQATAQLTGRSISQVWRWRQAKPEGTGGRIPAAVQELLIAKGRFRPADFFPRPGEAFK